jgi:hypothetical protein
MPALSNITILAPTGTSQHGREDFLCLPTRWTTILTFFVANYLTHALTIWRKPGEKLSEYTFAIILALLFPVSGLARGLDAIYRWASPKIWEFWPGSASEEIRKAARAGALAILVREHSQKDDLKSSSGSSRFEYNSQNWDGAVLYGEKCEWYENPLSVILCVPRIFAKYSLDHRPERNGLFNRRDDTAVIKIQEAGGRSPVDNLADLRLTRDISGLVQMHETPGYIVMELPKNFAEDIIMSDADSWKNKEGICFAKSSSAAQLVLAIVQIVYASYAIALDSGDEFQRYGYTSFSITVVPYIVMSFVNLLGNLVTPAYTNIYLIQTSALEEARSRNNNIQGTFGKITDRALSKGFAAPTGDDHALQNTQSRRGYKVKCSPGNSCPSKQRRSPVTMNGRAAPNRNQTEVKVCFQKECKDHSYQIVVPSGQPLKIPSKKKEILFKFLGIIGTLGGPIAVIVYIALNYPNPNGIKHEIATMLWIGVGDLIGLWMIWHRVTFVTVCADFRLLKIVVVKWLLPCGYRKEDGRYEKAKEELGSRPFQLFVSFLFVFLGPTVAGFNFYYVIKELLDFGDCVKYT